MTRVVMCRKLQQEWPGLENAPLPGALGERIYNEISAKAWEMWLRYQTILINENRLSTINPEHREILESQLKSFLFAEQQ
jgi:Fe-S cluster biosynthesis and repair protein YggX